MTKQNAVKAFAEKFGTTQAQADEMMQFSLDYMYDTAMDEGRCTFGPHKMVRKERAPRIGRNPRTGETIQIPGKTTVTYKRLSKS